MDIEFWKRIKKSDSLITVEKYNPYHGKDGRFTSAIGGGETPAIAGFSPSNIGMAKLEAKEQKAVAQAIASNRESDLSQVEGKMAWVREGLSTEPKPITRETPNYDKIMQESGCDLETAKASAVQADRVIGEYAKVEPQITSTIVDSVKGVGGTMFGLDFRMKGDTSMARKIAQDASRDGVSLEEAANGVKDAVRYTAVFDTKNFTEGYNATKSALEAQGYTETRCKNFYQMYKDGDSCQKAVQSVFADKAGHVFELQFHTVESQGTKEVNHPMYEEQRQTTTSRARKYELEARMAALGSKVPDPDGVYSIKSHK